jgi:putative oxidoreductase
MPTSSHSRPTDSRRLTALKDETRETLRGYADLFGRVLLMTLFLISGLGKITVYGETAGNMQRAGVPGVMLPLFIVGEVLGSFAIILGWRTRAISLLFACFTLASALLLENKFGDAIQPNMILKDLSIVGAFLLLAANGAGQFSLDAHRKSSSMKRWFEN